MHIVAILYLLITVLMVRKTNPHSMTKLILAFCAFYYSAVVMFTHDPSVSLSILVASTALTWAMDTKFDAARLRAALTEA